MGVIVSVLYEREELGHVAGNEEDGMRRYHGKTPLALSPLAQTPSSPPVFDWSPYNQIKSGTKIKCHSQHDSYHKARMKTFSILINFLY